MKFFLLLLVVVFHTSAVAQKKQFVTVKAGENIMDVLPASEIFSYRDFTQGKVFLRDGSKSEARLNYNRLVDEMHFISVKGDTLALDNEENVRYIVIGNDTFYYDQGYLKVVSTHNSARLAVRQVWIIADTRQLGAYNTTNNSAAMVTYTSVNEGGRLYDLVVNEDVILRKDEKYFFGDNFFNFVAADRGNLLTLFPKEEKKLNAYIREQKVNFKNKEHLEKLVEFVGQL